MIILFKHDTKKYVYDSASGAVIPLSSLQYKVAENVDFPMTSFCPTALRYQLAKYDSGDVKQAYSYLYALYERGVIGKEAEGAAILLDGELSADSLELGRELIDRIRSAGISPDKITFLGDSPLKDGLKQYL